MPYQEKISRDHAVSSLKKTKEHFFTRRKGTISPLKNLSYRLSKHLNHSLLEPSITETERAREQCEEPVFSSDLNNMSSISLKHYSPYQVPLLPSRNFNCITHSESERARPDLPLEDPQAGFPSQY